MSQHSQRHRSSPSRSLPAWVVIPDSACSCPSASTALAGWETGYREKVGRRRGRPRIGVFASTPVGCGGCLAVVVALAIIGGVCGS